MEHWREWLYPLGFISSLAFGVRFLAQWISSEIRGESTVTRLFWKISLIGNISLLVHSTIQMQYHVSMIQTCNAIISWRNLNLMGPQKKHTSLRSVFAMMLAGLVLITTVFSIQHSFSPTTWFRIPVTSWTLFGNAPVGHLWHFVGCIGLFLFSSRFWVQWWCAEKHKTSYLGPAFWWLSLIGASLNLVYFIRISDSVNILGNALGMTPYVRNLMLIMKQNRKATEGQS